MKFSIKLFFAVIKSFWGVQVLAKIWLKGELFLPYCYYYLGVLYFAKFSELEKSQNLVPAGTMMYIQSQTA